MILQSGLLRNWHRQCGDEERGEEDRERGQGEEMEKKWRRNGKDWERLRLWEEGRCPVKPKVRIGPVWAQLQPITVTCDVGPILGTSWAHLGPKRPKPMLVTSCAPNRIYLERKLERQSVNPFEISTKWKSFWSLFWARPVHPQTECLSPAFPLRSGDGIPMLFLCYSYVLCYLCFWNVVH